MSFDKKKRQFPIDLFFYLFWQFVDMNPKNKNFSSKFFNDMKL